MSVGTLSTSEESQLAQTIEMFEVITQSQPNDYQSLEILKEAYAKLAREPDVIAISKRIAKAYVAMGQLSSAILEYESILQRYPDDPDVLAALGEIESKATSLSAPTSPATELRSPPPAPPANAATKNVEVQNIPSDYDDGRATMSKIFVDGKILTATDFEHYWPKPDFNPHLKKPSGSFIQTVVDKGIMTIEQALKLLSDKSRLAYLPIYNYDVDYELARSLPAATCLRWAVLPFDRLSKSLMVATANPFNRQAALELEQAAKQRLLWYLAPPADILKALLKAFR
jgi:tetratricopeptide (TPR) repeat protein